MNISREIRAFLAGSAYPALFFPFALLSISSWAKPDSGFGLEPIVWFFPWALGLWNVLFVLVREKLPGTLMQKYWMWGLLLGMLMPIVGNLSGVPAKLWGLQFPQGLLVIPVGMIAYALVWRYAVRMMNLLIGVDETI